MEKGKKRGERLAGLMAVHSATCFHTGCAYLRGKKPKTTDSSVRVILSSSY